MPEAVGDCGGCYACCCYCGSPPFRNDAERAATDVNIDASVMLTDYYNTLEPGGQSRETQGLPCLWINQETGECLDYDHRPPICRSFEVGGVECSRFIALGLGAL